MSQSTPPNWLQLAIKAVEEAPDIERGVQVFLQRLHNEITNGTGLTNPILVTEVALQAAEDLAIALQTEGAGPVDEKPTSPSPGSSSDVSNTGSTTSSFTSNGTAKPLNPVLGGGTTDFSNPNEDADDNNPSQSSSSSSGSGGKN